MIATQCPKCTNELKVPESFLGKKVRCKVDGCGHVFAVEALRVSEPQPPPEQFVFTEPPISPGFEFDSSAPAPVGALSGTTSDARYPNLQLYLKWAKLFALVQLVIVILIACSIFLVSLIHPISQNYTIQAAIVPILMGTTIALLIGIGGYLVFLFCMAGIEFVNVIIDIETNTRTNRQANSEG